MRITIAAVGRWRSASVRRLYEDYVHRLGWPVALREVDSGRGSAAAVRRRSEGERLAAALPRGATVVVLDERGDQLDSAAFAARLQRWRDGGTRELAFVIGGADGLDGSLKERAAMALAFGRQTWPHLLVRTMLAEQLYRAYAISIGHPYHRE